MVTTPVYAIVMTIFTLMRPTQVLLYIFFVLLLYLLSCLNIFFCGGIFDSLYQVEGRPEWFVLAFFGAVIISGISLLVGATFLTKKASRRKYKSVVDEESAMWK
jgi:presenilin-like A22 family membrane protease